MADIGFERPQSVPEATEILAQAGSMALAGGTALMFLVRQHLIQPDRLVWIGDVAEMTGIDGEQDETRIGAATTLAELEGSPVVREQHSMLSAAAAAVGNPRVRSVATVGGALVHADPRQDILPALLAADATIHVSGKDGARSIRLRDDFFRGFMSVDLEDEELITHLTLPVTRMSRQRYARFTPDSPDEYPTVAVAASVCQDADGGLAGLDLALGGVAETPLFVDGLFGVLTSSPSSQNVVMAAEYAAHATSPVDDAQGSASYKRAMAHVWVERVLLDVLGPERIER